MTLKSQEEWSDLKHAYGDASDIPDLLHQLEKYPDEVGYQTEPYFTLWSSLCHQGDTYSASYHAVIEIVRLVKKEPTKATMSFFLLPTSIDESRRKSNGPPISEEIMRDYFEALSDLGMISDDLLRNSIKNKDMRNCLKTASKVGRESSKLLIVIQKNT